MTEQPKPTTNKKPSRTRRWAKIVALVIGALVLLAFLECSLLMLWGSRGIRREIEAVKALHEPSNWDELLLTDGRGHVATSSVAFAPADVCAIYAKALVRSKGWDKELSREFYNALAKGTPSPEDVQRLGEALSHYQEALALFREAARDDAFVNLPEDSPEFVTQRQLDLLEVEREAARLLRSQAFHAAAQGRADEAADTCIVLLRYARAFPGDNLMGGYVHFAVIGAACRAIEETQTMAPSSAEKLDAIRQALKTFVDDIPMPRIFCGERVCGSYLFQSGWVKEPRFLLWPNHAAYLELMREAVSASRMPFPESLWQMEKVRSRYDQSIGPSHLFSVFAQHLMYNSTLLLALEEGARSQARIRATLVSLAIRRAKLDGMALPASLHELVPKYLSAIPTDPFTGEPLKYRVDETGCKIYSVGPGGVDKGGAAKAMIGSGGNPGQDIGVRLPR